MLGETVGALAGALLFLIFIVLAASPALGQPLMITTYGDGAQLFLYDQPGVGLPTPTETEITLTPPGFSFPHGLAFQAQHKALVANFLFGRSVFFWSTPRWGR